MSTPLVFKEVREEDFPTIAKQLATQLQRADPFVLWLEGDMGMGKTTFTRYLLQAFGLPTRLPVQSPTFTYIQDYVIGHEHYAHIDLYRLAPEAMPGFFQDLSEQNFRGYVVEWPSLMPAHLDLQKPTHRLIFGAGNSEETRLLHFEKTAP